MDEGTEHIGNTFSQLETEELLGRINSGTLTEEAHKIALEELKARNLSTSPAQPTPPSSIQIDEDTPKKSYFLWGMALLVTTSLLAIVVKYRGLPNIPALNLVGSLLGICLGNFVGGYLLQLVTRRLTKIHLRDNYSYFLSAIIYSVNPPIFLLLNLFFGKTPSFFLGVLASIIVSSGIVGIGVKDSRNLPVGYLVGFLITGVLFLIGLAFLLLPTAFIMFATASIV